MPYVVQDRESGLFLRPLNGDVGFTQWLHEAGRFSAPDEACDTAEMHCFEGYHLTQVVNNLSRV